MQLSQEADMPQLGMVESQAACKCGAKRSKLDQLEVSTRGSRVVSQVEEEDQSRQEAACPSRWGKLAAEKPKGTKWKQETRSGSSTSRARAIKLRQDIRGKSPAVE